MSCYDNLTAEGRKESVDIVLSSIKKLNCEDDKERSFDLFEQLSHLIREKNDITKNAICTLKEAKRQCAADPEMVDCIGNLQRKIKQIYKGSTSFLHGSDDTPSTIKKVEKSENSVGNASTETAVVDTSSVSHCDDIPEARLKIINAFKDCLKNDTASTEKTSGIRETASKVVSVARDIECEIDRQHPFATNSQDYQSKSRQIYFHLKKNKVQSINLPNN